MRNYLYLSDAKVDTLLPQISTDEKRRLALRLGFDVKVFNVVADFEKLPLTNRVHRLEAVETRLREEGRVGGLSGRTSWFEGAVHAMPMTVDSGQNVIFFLARNLKPGGGYQVLGLGGSAHHVVGNLRPNDATSSLSHLHSLLGTLRVMDSDAVGASVIRKNDEALAFHMEAGVRGTGNWSPLRERHRRLPRIHRGKPADSRLFVGARLEGPFPSVPGALFAAEVCRFCWADGDEPGLRQDFCEAALPYAVAALSARTPCRVAARWHRPRTVAVATPRPHTSWATRYPSTAVPGGPKIRLNRPSTDASPATRR